VEHYDVNTSKLSTKAYSHKVNLLLQSTLLHSYQVITDHTTLLYWYLM